MIRSCCFPSREEGPVLGGRLFIFRLCVDRVLSGVSSGRCPAGMLSALGVIEPPDMVFAIEPQNSDFLAHQWTQLLAHLLRENKFPVRKIRYALPVLAPDTEKNMALLFEFSKTARSLKNRFISYYIVMHCNLLM